MISSLKEKRIGEILLEHGLIQKEDIEKALLIQKEKGGLIGMILVEAGLLKEEDLAFALATQFNYPYLSLDTLSINRNLFKEFPKEFLIENCFVPIEKTRDVLTVAVADPSDESTLRRISERACLRVLAFVAGVTQIKEMIVKIYGTVNGAGALSGKPDRVLKKAAEEKMKKGTEV